MPSWLGDMIGVDAPDDDGCMENGEALAAFLAAYMLASSWALPMFFL